MVEKEVDSIGNEGLICPNTSIKLTPAEQEVLDMIAVKFYTLKQIQTIRNCSKQAVYKIFKNLKEKGAINLGLQKVDSNQWASQPKPNQIRLHGQEFNIKLLWQDNRYQEVLKKANILYLDGHIIRLYQNSIEIYAGEGISFIADTPERAEKKSLEYWYRLFTRLEHKLNALILKEGTNNIRLVNSHYARGNSEICEKAIEEGNKIKIYAVEDNKLAFITDDSFSMKEDETVHPITAKPDRKAIDKQVNDWRINDPPTNSELATNINNFVLGFDTYGKHIVSHVGVLNNIEKTQYQLSKSIKQLTRVMKGILSENQSLKLSSKHQTLLGAFT